MILGNSNLKEISVKLYIKSDFNINFILDMHFVCTRKGIAQLKLSLGQYKIQMNKAPFEITMI